MAARLPDSIGGRASGRRLSVVPALIENFFVSLFQRSFIYWHCNNGLAPSCHYSFSVYCVVITFTWLVDIVLWIRISSLLPCSRLGGIPWLQQFNNFKGFSTVSYVRHIIPTAPYQDQAVRPPRSHLPVTMKLGSNVLTRQTFQVQRYEREKNHCRILAQWYVSRMKL